MSRMMKVLLGMLSVVLLFGCDDGDDTPTSTVRFLQAVPTNQAVDVYLNNTRIAQGATYNPAGAGNVQYNEVASGNYTAQVFAANADPATAQPLLSQAITLQETAAYTLMTVGSTVNPTTPVGLLVTTDDNGNLQSGKIRLRFIHAAPFNPAVNVDVYVTGPNDDIANVNPTLANIPFQSGRYVQPDFNTGTYRIRVTPTGSKTVVSGADTGTLDLGDSLTIRTFVLTGDGTGNPPVALATLNDFTP